MRNQTAIREICAKIMSLSFHQTVILLLVILTTSVTQVFADFAYVVNQTDSNVSIIDTNSNTVVGNPIPVGFFPSAIAITPDEKFAYVTSILFNTVSVIDTSSNTVVGNPIPVGKNPQAIAITPDGQFAYVANRDDFTVSIIDINSNTVVGSPIRVGNKPLGIAITPNGEFAYVTNTYDIFGGFHPPIVYTVSVIDTSSNTVVGAPIPVGNNPVGVAITPEGGFAYAVNFGSNTVSVIDTNSNTVVGAPIPVGASPSRIAMTPNGQFAYVTNNQSHNVSVIDTSSNTVVASPIPVGDNPSAIAITSDGAFAYVANFTDHTVSVIDTSSNTVVGSPISVGSCPAGIAICSQPPLPPQDLVGYQQKNPSGQILFNVLRWKASPSTTVAGYFVYRNGIKIASLDASTLKYKDRDIKKKEATLYSITAFNAKGKESSPISITMNANYPKQ